MSVKLAAVWLYEPAECGFIAAASRLEQLPLRCGGD
jgi:hypothetical protein